MKKLDLSQHALLAQRLQKRGLLQAAQTPTPVRNPILSVIERIWIEESVRQRTNLHTLGLWLEFESPLSEQVVLDSFEILQKRHTVLRTQYVAQDASLRAVVRSDVAVPLGPKLTEEQARGDLDLLQKKIAELALSIHAEKLWHIFPAYRGEGICGVLLAFHHAVTDWAGAQILVREFMQIVQKQPFDPLEQIKQPDDVAREVDQHVVARKDQLKNYWHARLRNASSRFQPAAMLAGGQASRPVTRETASRRTEWHLTQDLAHALNQLCRSWRTTPYFFILTIYKQVLKQISHQNEVLITTTLSNRDRPHHDKVVGCLSDLLLLRCDLDGEQDFVNEVRKLQETSLNDFLNADLGFLQITDILREAGQPHRSTQAELIYNYLPAWQPLTGVTVKLVPYPVARADLSFEIIEHPDTLQLTLECRADFLSQLVFDSVTETLKHWILSCVRDPGLKLPDLHCPAHTTTAAVLRGGEALTPAKNLVALFRQAVLLHPHEIAAEHNANVLSFEALDHHSTAIARRLLDTTSIKPGDPVLLCMPRCLDLLIASLACLKTGAVMVLIDPAHPPERQQRIARLSRAQVALTCAGANPDLPFETSDLSVLQVSLAAQKPVRTQTLFASPSLDAHSPAFMVFTSGSTGQPKGVIGTHGALVNRIAWMNREFPAQEGDIACLKTSTGFVDFLAEMLGPLCSGIKLIIADQDTATHPDRLLDFLASNSITRLVLVPSLLQAMLSNTDEAASKLAKLKLCTCSGEALSSELARQFLHLAPQCQLLNIYGSSEVTADATCQPVKQVTTPQIPIGLPLTGFDLALVDSGGYPVADGFIGQLAIAGIGLTLGYLDDPENTALRYRPLPAFQGERGFLTGDEAVRTASNEIMLLGRSDRQFKVEGVRLEAAEIEAVFRTLDGVLDCRLVLLSDESRQKIALFLVSNQPHALTVTDIRQHALTWLPRAAMPNLINIMSQWPLGPNGKIDENALRHLASDTEREVSSTEERSQDWDPRCAEIRALWEQILEKNILSPQADFFASGGTSLKALVVMSKLSDRLNIRLETRLLFECSKLCDLARLVDEKLSLQNDVDSHAIALASVVRMQQAPLTFNQQWLARQNELDPESTAYNLAIAYRINGAISQAALHAALNDLFDRHPALRAHQEKKGDTYQQCFQDRMVAPLEILHLPLSCTESIQTSLQSMIETPFNLSHPPLIRLRLIQANEHLHWLMISAHHWAMDGWSGEVLMRELSRRYAFHLGVGAEEQQPASTGIDQVALQQQQNTPHLKNKLHDYHAFLASAHCPQLFETRQDQPRGGRAACIGLDLPTGLLEGIAKQQANSPDTIFMVSVCAFALALKRFDTRSGPLLLGYPDAGRHEPHLLNTVGFLANTVLAGLDIDLQASWRSNLAGVRQSMIQSMRFSEVPLAWVSSTGAGWQYDSASSEHLHAMVVPEQNFDWGLALEGLEVSLSEQARSTRARVDLALLVREKSGQSTLEIEYDSDRIPAGLAQRLAIFLTALLNTAARAPDTPLERLLNTDLPLPVMSLTGTQTVSTIATQPAGSLGDRLERAFEVWARQAPEDIVCIGQTPDQHTQQESIASLWIRAGVIAQSLSHSIPSPLSQAPTVIALHMERSVEWLATLLGIWRLGATALILDQAWPLARVKQVLEDAEASLLVVQNKDDTLAVNLPVRCLSASSDIHDAIGNQTEPVLNADRTNRHPWAAIVYTSGTTGKPKGIPLSHQALLRLGASLTESMTLRQGDRLLQAVGQAFDVTLSDIAAAVASRATLVLLPASQLMPGSSLQNTLATYRIQHMQVAASVLSATAAIALPELKCVVVGGETCPKDTLASWSQKCAVLIAYGPTETTVTTTLMPYSQSIPTGLLGQAIAGNRLAVVNEQGQPVPRGVSGELLITGTQVSDGYIGHAQANLQSFGLTQLFEQSMRCYLTGDHVWMDGQGNLHFLGRLDRQIKIRGHRIDPEEIERTLQSHEVVSRAAVSSAQSDQGNRDLHAWITCHPSASVPTETVLRQWLAQRLPEAFVPQTITVLQSFPLTVNGKIDWQALPEPVLTQTIAPGESETEDRPDSLDDMEDLIEALWSVLLNKTALRRDRTFFEYGGHSLLTTTLHQMLEKKLQVAIPIAELFAHPTIETLAGYLFEYLEKEKDQ